MTAAVGVWTSASPGRSWGGGLVVPGGSLGGMGVGGWILHRFGMPTGLIAERQFNLSFINTGVDALALVVFGLGSRWASSPARTISS